MSKRVAIGIDLGTTYSCVGVFQNGRVDIIANNMGSRITPSYVAFDDVEVHVGEAAKNQASVNAKNTVFESKRLIGRKFADNTVQEDMKQWPFEVLDDNGSPKIRVQYCEEMKLFPPEIISAMILEKMKKDAEDFIGQEVIDAVITVPAYFNDSQRQATIDAGKIAGLSVLQILNEPTAAALAYGHFKKVVVDQTVLVFDLGGGTFDVSILTISDKKFVVKAVGGDTHLGGGDFDSRVTAYYREKIKEKYNTDIFQNPKSLGRLKKACETAKVGLSTASRANVNVACLINGEDFREILSRIKFEQLCIDLFKKTIEHVKDVLADAGLNKSDIDEVILVGGSSRIPKIKEMLSEFFDGKKLNSTINPDEAVAYGASVKAALASGEHPVEDFTLADVVPRSLGLKSYDDAGNLRIFIKRNSQIPLTIIQTDWTTANNFTQVVPVDVFEGEQIRAEDNNLLGIFHFDVGEKVRAGVPKLTYTFTIDENGILHVSGVNENTQYSAGISIASYKGRLTKDEIERMVLEVKQLKM